jgi:hypothetical protein
MEKTIHIEAQQMDAGSDQSEGHAKQIEVLRPYNYCITPSGDEEVMLINVRLGSMSGQSMSFIRDDLQLKLN